MTLKEYLTNNGVQLSWFAKQIPCSVPYLCIIVNRGRIPSAVIRRRIKDLTNGQVGEDDYGVEYPPRTYKKRDENEKQAL